MTPDDEARLLTREQFLANLRAMPSGPEYGRLADHDAELRAQLAKCREAITSAVECADEDRDRVCPQCIGGLRLAATQDEET